MSVFLRFSLMVACPPLSSGTWCCETDGVKLDSCCSEPSNLLTLGQAAIVTAKPSTSTESGLSTTVASRDSTSTPTSSGATTPTSSPASSSGLSDSAKVGIGIGIPFGAIIIVLLVGIVYFIKQVRPKTQNYGGGGQDHFQAGLTNGFQQQVGWTELEQHQNTHELEDTVPRPYQDSVRAK
ncbi:hypothetical protein MMC29_004884 [Sticta canariensis]|nr:hypothetical protein [Sticta canariensis]